MSISTVGHVQACPGPATPSEVPFTCGDLDPIKYMFPADHPNDISIGSAVVAELTIVTDRQTDHVTSSLTIGRVYVVLTIVHAYEAFMKDTTRHVH